MTFRFLIVSFCFCLFAVNAAAFPQGKAADNMILVEGLTETAAGCPIALSEARYQRPKVIAQQDGLTQVHELVKIQNASGKAIRKAIIAFRHEGPKNGGLSGIFRSDTVTKSIAIGEELAFKHTYQIGTEKPLEGYNGIFTAIALAVEFEDDTHWVKPSTDDIPMEWQMFSRQDSPLVVRKCENIDNGYRAILETRSDQVVAYRLGVVKDTPNGFDVRLGEWIEMPKTSTPNRTEIAVSATDKNVSLPQSWLFKRDRIPYDERLGYRGTRPVGVALFVAEVKLADGTVWKQALTRDELMWGLYNQ